MGTVEIDSSSINSSDVYSGGRDGGMAFWARDANSSGNFSTKLCVGHAQASPNAQMVRPAMLSPIVFSVFGSSTTRLRGNRNPSGYRRLRFRVQLSNRQPVFPSA